MASRAIGPSLARWWAAALACAAATLSTAGPTDEALLPLRALPQTWAVRLEWPPVPEGSALAETTYQVERGASAAELRTYAANVPGVGANTSRTFAGFEPPQTLVSHFVDTEALPGRRYAYRLSEKINGSLTGRRSAIVEGSAAEATPRMPRFPRGSAGPATRRPPPPRSRLGMWDLVSISEKRCPEEAGHAGITEPFWRDGVASLFAGGGAFERIQRQSNEIWWTLRFPFGEPLAASRPRTVVSKRSCSTASGGPQALSRWRRARACARSCGCSPSGGGWPSPSSPPAHTTPSRCSGPPCLAAARACCSSSMAMAAGRRSGCWIASSLFCPSAQGQRHALWLLYGLPCPRPCHLCRR